MHSLHKISTAVSVTILASLSVPAQLPAQEVRVTIVTILANDRNQVVDSKLTEVRREVQKREPNLTGFRLGRVGHRDINVGQKEAIKLFDNDEYSADIKLLAKNDSKKRVTIEVKPPQVGAITYETCYDKFFPIVTRSVVNGERLIIGIMVKPTEKVAKP